MALLNVPYERYKYSISDVILTSDNFEEPITIDSRLVSSLSIINDYENSVSPKVQLVFGVKKTMYEDITLNMNTLTATFTVYKTNIGEITDNSNIDNESNIYQDYKWIDVTLKAVNENDLSTKDANTLKTDDTVTIDTTSENLTGDDIVSITLLLYDNKAIDLYRKSKYYVIDGGKNDVLYNFFRDRNFNNVLMTPTNNDYGRYVIPYGHLGNNIDTMNSYYGIYQNPYLFYMDFDTTYLLEKGRNITLRANELQNVCIQLLKNDDSSYVNNGCYIDYDNNQYVLNSSNFSINDNDSSIDYAIGGNITTIVSGDGTIKHDKIGDYNTERLVIVNNQMHHSQLIYNIKEQKRNLVLTFSNIDASIITPNKLYVITPDSTVYKSQYQIEGKYRLTKRLITLLRGDDKGLKSSIQIYLNKIPD